MKLIPRFSAGRDKNIHGKMMHTINVQKKVKVYYNLHKKCLSVQQAGKVRCHTNYICMKDCEFKVSQAGRQRVLKEKKKNVHAFVIGYLTAPEVLDTFCPSFEEGCDVTYNPYKYNSFIDKKDGTPIKTAEYVDIEASPNPDIIAWFAN